MNKHPIEYARMALDNAEMKAESAFAARDTYRDLYRQEKKKTTNLLQTGTDFIGLANGLIEYLLENLEENLDDMDRIAINKWSQASQQFQAVLDEASEGTEETECPVCGDSHEGAVPLGCETGDGV